MTISKEKSLISNVSALEFAKRLLVYKVTLYFSPVSLRVLRILSSGVSAFLFSELLRLSLFLFYVKAKPSIVLSHTICTEPSFIRIKNWSKRRKKKQLPPITDICFQFRLFVTSRN